MPAFKKVREVLPELTEGYDVPNIPEDAQYILRLLALYRDRCAGRGYEIQSEQWPLVTRKQVWRSFKGLVAECMKRGIDPAVYIEAQFAMWPEEATYPYPFVRNFISENLNLPPGAYGRWERYSNLAKEKFNTEQTPAHVDELVEKFKDSKYILDQYMKASGEEIEFRAFVALGRDLDPRFMASYPIFVQNWLNRLDGTFDPVKKWVKRMMEDPVLRLRIMNARRAVMGQ